MSIPLWAHAYDNYILTEKGWSIFKKSKKKPKPNQAIQAAARKGKENVEKKRQQDEQTFKNSTDPKEIIKSLVTNRYQSIIVLPVEEMSEEDLQYVLDYASDSEDIEMDGQNYMMGDIRPELYKLLNKSDWVPVPSGIDDNNLIKEKPDPITNAIEVVDTTIGSDEGEKRIGKQNSNDENPTSRIETKTTVLHLIMNTYRKI